MDLAPVVRSAGLAAALALFAAPAPPPADELHEAPNAAAPGAPPEATLTPPPDGEKSETAPGYVEILNPAFPHPVVPPQPVVDLGPLFRPEDFGPYFAEGALAEARAAFDRGRYDQVREALKDVTTPPARYLRALAAVRAEDWTAAAAEMEALADDYPAVRDRCLTHAGVAFEALGRYEDAARVLRQVPPDSRMYPDARLALFRVLRDGGHPDEAIAAIQPLTTRAAPSWGRDVGAEALLAVADLERARKRRDEERAALEALWALHPLSALSKQASARLDVKKLPLERWVDRAETLVDAHRNREGLALLEPLLDRLHLPDPLACRGRFIYGKALRKERAHSKAIAVLDPVVEQCTDPQLRPRAMYVLGSSKSIVQEARAIETYEALAAKYPEHSFADDALFYAADVHLQLGQVDEALARLQELADKYPDGDFAGDGLFKSFWIHKQRGELSLAFAILDQIERIFAGAAESYEVERARYWRARLLERQGDTARARAIFTALATEHPATYYGLIARRRLAALTPEEATALRAQLSSTAPGTAWPLHAGKLAEDPHFRAGVELLRMGFNDAVSSELLAVDRTTLEEEPLRLLVQLLALAGDARSAHAVARTSLRGDLSGPITPETRPIWEVAYPRAFRDLIERHCKSPGIEPDLLQALMREESALDPRALSWAGALGLTQLMPYTAKAVGRRIGLKHLTTQQILDPDINIRIGSAYLGELVKRFDGVYEYALAGYNAGGGAVSRWRRERPDLELDEWVEEIPIAETRGYVKRVLRSYNTYQLLYPELAPLSVVAPK